jgi:hypothetical protein
VTVSKLGTGTNYSGLSGFSWPTNLNPRTFNIPSTKKHKMIDIDFSDINIIMDSGSSTGSIGLSGELFTVSDFNNLRKQINFTSLTSVGDVQDYNQKLYLDSSTQFYWVRGGSFIDSRSADLPTSYPYTCTLIKVHPFFYYDSIAGTSNTTTNTTCVVSGTDLNNDGSAYAFPYFEITNNTGSSITGITVTDGTNTITWNGTLASGKSLRIIQEHLPDYNLDGWTAYLYDDTTFTLTPTSQSGLSGDKIYFLGSTGSHSITFTLTGNDNTATCAVRFRERDY